MKISRIPDFCAGNIFGEFPFPALPGIYGEGGFRGMRMDTGSYS
jgi:hypothetical protein